MTTLLQVREIVEHVKTVHIEQGRTLEQPHQVAIVAVVIANPYGSGYVDDLVTLANEVGPELGALVGPRVVELLDGHIESFGKAAVVGYDGEVEHGSALIHNLRFGNVFRGAAEGTELLPSCEKCGAPGTPMDIPLKHKLDSKTRSHHQSATFQIADAPRLGEIVIACAGSNRGRPLARLATYGAEVTP